MSLGKTPAARAVFPVGPTRPARYRLSVRAARAGLLFTSVLRRSAEPTAGQVRRAVADAVRAFGSRGCAERVAREFGDHLQTATARMRWARSPARRSVPA